MEIELGRSKRGVPVVWTGMPNAYAYISGSSGMGKSHFIKRMLPQMVEQACLCVVFDCSDDFAAYEPPAGIGRYELIDVRELAFNPLASSAERAIYQFMNLVEGLFRLGTRNYLEVVRCAQKYVRAAEAPSVEGLAVYLQAASSASPAAVSAVSLIGGYCRGTVPIDLDLNTPGLVVVALNAVSASGLRTCLMEMIFGIIWEQRAVPGADRCPMVFIFDECQKMRWKSDCAAVRLLREGRKYRMFGWFSPQFMSNKEAVAALRQASLQAHFRPDEAEILRLARTFSPSGSAQTETYRMLISSLQRGQFLYQDGNGRPIVVRVEP